MRRTLSSSLTFPMKVLFPTVWIGAVSFVTMAVFAGSDDLEDKSIVTAGSVKWILLLFLLLGAAFAYWTCIRLKAVGLDDEALYVSNYLDEVRVPLSEIEEVTQNIWLNTRPITITFSRPTVFGRRIVFMPGRPLFTDDGGPAEVEQIRTAIARAALAASARLERTPDIVSDSAGIVALPDGVLPDAPHTDISSSGPGQIRREQGTRG